MTNQLYHAIITHIIETIEIDMLLVIDDFLDREDKIYKEIASVFSNENYHKPLPSHTWMDKDKTAENVWEKMSQKIWKFATPFTSDYVSNGYEGIEYWANRLHENKQLDWHIDKDEALYAERSTINTPILGSVYYAHTDEIYGGYLEIQRRGPTNTESFERIEPVHNRLVIFNSSATHRVDDIVWGLRQHFATNIWSRKPLDKNYV